MTRGQHVALRRWQRHRRGSIYLAAENFGDVLARAETLGAALDRFRRRAKWARRSAAGYREDWMDELLGVGDTAIVILEPVSAPTPAFITDAVRAARKGKHRPEYGEAWNTAEAVALEYAKMYYGILNHTMSEATAVREIERVIVADHDLSAPLDEIRRRLPTMQDTREIIMVPPTAESAPFDAGQRVVGPYVANPGQLHRFDRGEYRDSNRRHGQ